jgi:hypothetical protein
LLLLTTAAAESDVERFSVMVLPSKLRSALSSLAILAPLTAGTLLLAPTAQAASVYNCSSSGQKCVVKVEEGIIGDHVKVLDDRARVIATGRIIKRRGAYAVVSVMNTSQTIRKGYPVIVDIENRDSNLQWAASFSNKE